MFNRIKQRWSEESGYREVLVISIPLILSTGAWSILLFFDRMFLAWYSPASIAAAMPAGMTSFAMLCFFIGTAAYVNTFVAQYFGADEEHKIGAIVWQGIYFSSLSLLVIIPAYFLARFFFDMVGHEPEVRLQETVYFKILMYSSVFMVLNNALGSFFSGLGKTLVVMWVSLLITAINIGLDYCLIFGNFGFPEMGIRGAATASNIAVISGSILYLYLVFQKKYRDRFNLNIAWKFNAALFRRLIHFGAPNGLRLFIDMSAFTAFLMFVGTLGTLEGVSTNIAFNIEALSFLPMVGLMIGVAVIVGQRLGENKPELAEKAAWSAVHIAVAFFGILALLYLIVPQLFIYPFTIKGSLTQLVEVQETVAVLLRFIAFFCLLDAIFLVFLGVLEGAGDTHFVLKMSILLSIGCFIIPCYIYLRYFDASLYGFWWIITINVLIYCLVFFWRFSKGPWRTMRVIEIS